MNKRKVNFPKNFFKKERPEINLQDSLKDVIPVKWNKKASSSNDSSKILKRKNSITEANYK